MNGAGEGGGGLNGNWLAYIHGAEVAAERVSETTTYINHIEKSELETSNCFERENIQTENIPLTRSTEISKNKKGHKPDNLDPEPSLSESSSKTSLSNSISKKNKRDKKKIVSSIGKMTHQTHIRAMILILPMTVIIDAGNSKIRAIIKRIQSNYARV